MNFNFSVQITSFHQHKHGKDETIRLMNKGFESKRSALKVHSTAPDLAEM